MHIAINFPRSQKKKKKLFGLVPFHHHAFAMIGPPQQPPPMAMSQNQHTIFVTFSRTQEL
jgi:hypothetical protein